MKNDSLTSDLEKCLYYALEVLSEASYTQAESKKNNIVILGASGGRLDYTLNTIFSVIRNEALYDHTLTSNQIIMLSKSSATILLKPGDNIIYHSLVYEDQEGGFSIVPMIGEGTIKFYEYDLMGKETFVDRKFYLILEKLLKSGFSILTKKKTTSQKIKISLECDENSVFMYISTLKYHSTI